jgi:hypothetical protein
MLKSSAGAGGAGAGAGAGGAEEGVTEFVLTKKNGETLKLASLGFKVNIYEDVGLEERADSLKDEQVIAQAMEVRELAAFNTWREAQAFTEGLPTPQFAQIQRIGWNNWKLDLLNLNPPAEEAKIYKKIISEMLVQSEPYLLVFTGGPLKEEGYVSYKPPYVTADPPAGVPGGRTYLMMTGLKCVFLLMSSMFDCLQLLESMPMKFNLNWGYESILHCAVHLQKNKLSQVVMWTLWAKIKNPEQLAKFFLQCGLSVPRKDLAKFFAHTPTFGSLLFLTEEKLKAENLPKYIEYLRCLLAFKVDISAVLDHHGNFLHQALANEINCVPIIIQLNKLTNNTFDFMVRDSAGNTLLMMAILTRHAGNALALMMQMKLQQTKLAGSSATQKLTLTKNNAGWDELDAAIMLGLPDIVLSLLVDMLPEGDRRSYASTHDDRTACAMLESVYTFPSRQVSENRSIVDSYQFGLFCTVEESGEKKLLVKSRENAEAIALLAAHLSRVHKDHSVQPLESPGLSVLEACQIGYSEAQRNPKYGRFFEPSASVDVLSGEFSGTLAFGLSAVAGGGGGSAASEPGASL